MRSRGRLLTAAAAVMLVATFACHAQEPPTGAFTRAEVDKAIVELKKDPNLAGERSMRTLKWAGKKDKKENEARSPGWLAWIGELLAWVSQGARFLFWGVLAVLTGLLLVYLWRVARNWSSPGSSGAILAPSFVRDLDIRPESLPADVGAAARQLWDSGEHRAALALLYRGLLSRLVHVHRVPIKDSSTEGDCLALASRHLTDEERKAYVASLVRLWQRAVYGGETVATESVYTLCDGFARALDQPEAAAAAPAAAAAGAGA